VEFNVAATALWSNRHLFLQSFMTSFPFCPFVIAQKEGLTAVPSLPTESSLSPLFVCAGYEIDFDGG